MIADELRAEIACLRAGEADASAEPGLVPTPAQWIRKWNDGTAEQRLKWAALVLAHAEQATRCFEMDHEGHAIATIQAALEALPAQCRYHGEATEPSDRDRLYGREACCDTGIPAERRKKAEQALTNLAKPRVRIENHEPGSAEDLAARERFGLHAGEEKST